MNRRDFLKRAFAAGGIAALAGLGLSPRAMADFLRGSGGGGGGGDCTGDTTFYWPMTGTFNNTDRSNIALSGGCSIGDASVTLESSAVAAVSPSGRDGYSLYIPGAYDVASFDLSSYDLWAYSSGTLTFDLNVHTWANSCWLFSVMGSSAADEFIVMLYDDNELRLQYEGSNAGPVRATTVDANLALDTWYSVTAKWRAGATDPSLSLNVNSITATSDTDLTAWTNSPTTMEIGNASGVATAAYYLKNVRIYNAWQA